MLPRITAYMHDGQWIKLIKPDRVGNSDNTFTVVVGKNGIGKSRLLADIAKSYTKEYVDLDTGLFVSKNSYKSKQYELAPKVVAVSTSPFDKFPSSRKRSGVDIQTNYRYVGMRSDGMYQASSAVSLISSAAKGLLDKLLVRSGNHNLLAVFESLSFHPVVDFIFKPGYIKSNTDYYDLGSIEGTSLAIDLRCLERDHGIQVDGRYLESLERYSLGRRHKILESMVKVNSMLTQRKAVELTVDFSGGVTSLDGRVADDSYIEAMIVLMNAGLLRLMDLRLQKIGYGDLSLKRASSGEQCLLVLMFGVAGHITDGSLILIDEPEISLHPRWQEEFMMLLTTSFSAYSGCQFIVATHSPQIISRLKDKGCFVLSLSKSQLFDAEDFFQRSADYQLAELFDAPGIMNEYISRLAFNLLAKVKASRSMSPESSKDLERLLELNMQVEYSDPVKELIGSVVEVCNYYANH